MRSYRFTLIELLVTIGIIAILASILLPSLKKVRETGKNVTCRSNFKNSMVGCLGYADDHKGWGPPHYIFYPGVPVPERTWGTMLDYCGYLPKSAVTLCPAWIPAHNKRTIYECSGMFLTASWGALTYCRWMPLPRALSDSPSAFWVLGDSISMASLSQTSHITKVAGNPGRLHFRHLGMANAAFLDGHVDKITVKNAMAANYKVFYTSEEVSIP